MAAEPELGIGDYTAEQRDGEVHVQATGMAPAAGYRVWLAPAMIAVYPPEFSLYWVASEDFAVDMMTPYTADASFPADEPVEHITIHDADGAHRVEVEQAS